MWTSLPRTLYEWSNHDKYLVVALQLLGNSWSCYKNNCITKWWSPALNFSIYTWFLDTILHVLRKMLRTVFNILFIILKSSLSFSTHMEISNSLSQILNSIQLIHSEHTVIQTLLYPINSNKGIRNRLLIHSLIWATYRIEFYFYLTWDSHIGISNLEDAFTARLQYI